MDRWIDLLAASYGMPRIVLLRELSTPLHLAREIARMVAEQERAAQPSTTAHQTDDLFRRFATTGVWE